MAQLALDLSRTMKGHVIKFKKYHGELFLNDRHHPLLTNYSAAHLRLDGKRWGIKAFNGETSVARQAKRTRLPAGRQRCVWPRSWWTPRCHRLPH